MQHYGRNMASNGPDTGDPICLIRPIHCTGSSSLTRGIYTVLYAGEPPRSSNLHYMYCTVVMPRGRKGVNKCCTLCTQAGPVV
jgi:hypothetical protein